MQLDELQAQRIRHLLECLTHFQNSDEHGKMVEADTLEECRMKAITGKAEQYELYKQNLFMSQRMLHDAMTDFYALLDNYEFDKERGLLQAAIHN